MFTVARTKRTYISGGVVDETMSNHFILPFEAFAARTSGAAGHRTVVRSRLGMDVCVGTIKG